MDLMLSLYSSSSSKELQQQNPNPGYFSIIVCAYLCSFLVAILPGGTERSAHSAFSRGDRDFLCLHTLSLATGTKTFTSSFHLDLFLGISSA